MAEKQSHRQWSFSLIYLVLTVVFMVYIVRSAGMPERPKIVAYSDFLQLIDSGQLAEVNVGNTQLIGTRKSAGKGQDKRVAADRLPGIDERSLVSQMEKNGVKFSGTADVRPWWISVLSWSFPLLILFGFYGYAMWRMRQGVGGALSFGRNRAKIHDESTQISVTFADVAGIEEVKAELTEIVDFLKNPQKYQRLGGRIPKGVLLVGPPGTGKTLLARAVSGEAGVPFFSISGSEFVEMFVGVGAARVRDLFEQAKEKAPCIIFIDELDAVGKSRASGRGAFVGNDEREQTLNQLLVEMDGFDTSRGVIIVAATNTPEVLDPALLRAGRFDRQIIIDQPDLADREAILRVHAGKVRLSSDVDLKTLAARTAGMVGADLANTINEAALLAARREANLVEMRDMEEAIDRVTLGLQKKSRVMTPEEKERVAYHEAGHALVAISVPHADTVHRVSIIPRAVGALGHTLQLPTQEKYLMTKPELDDRIAVMLGGRASEEIVYDGVVSTGAANDLDRASELARQMVTRFGMSDRLGNLSYGRPANGRFLLVPMPEERNYSEHTAEQIDEEVRRIIDAMYDRVTAVIRSRRDALDRVVRELIRKETLSRAELDRLINHSAAQPKTPASELVRG